MSIELPNRLISALLERKALLWVCQRSEMVPGVPPQNDSASPADVLSSYRSDPNTDDFGMAKVFWEACWTESVVDHFYDAVNHTANSQNQDTGASETRLPYRLSSDPDVEGQIDRRRFLPIYEVNGTNRLGDPEGNFGGSPARRLAYKMGLVRRLENFPGRVLLVVGALDSSDLETVRIAIDFIPSNSMLVILWPPESPIPDDLKHSGRVDIQFLIGTKTDLVDALASVDAPLHGAAPRLGVRYGRATFELREEDLVGIDQEFDLIRIADLEAPTTGGDHAVRLERLWRSEPDDWLPFASEMVFRRHYRPFSNTNADLAGYVTSQLRELVTSDRVANVTLTIPATSGSGITTALRYTAFIAACAGFPALLCKPTNQNFSIEKLGAFLNRLQERNRGQPSSTEDVPALIIFDRQHKEIQQVSELATTLAARGRHALVIAVVPPGGDDFDGSPARRPKGKHFVAEEFRGLVDEAELRSLAEHFSNLFAPLHPHVPRFSEWLAYQERHSVQTLSGGRAAESLFWIALRFFVGESNPHFDLASWIGRTFEERVTDPEARHAVRYIAAFSSFGIAVPLVPLLRSIGTTKMLDTNIIRTLREISEKEDLLQWGDSEEHLYDQTISFKHRLIAIQLLNQLSVEGWEGRLRECWGLLETLEASPVADSWLVEALVFETLRVERFETFANDRLIVLLETLDHIPSVIAGRSASTQHHWARALSFRARNAEDTSEKIFLYTQSIQKLVLACELAENQRGREHPRNIYNSLGVARSELSRTLRSDGQGERAEDIWQSAADAFDLALRFGSDNFVVLSAYAHRLIEHAREVGDSSVALPEIANALSYLAQAEEAALLTDSLSEKDVSYIEMERNNAWNVTDPHQAERHIENLISEGNEIGFVLKAHRTLGHLSSKDWESGTASSLAQAFDILLETYTGPADNHSWRSIFLLYRVVSALLDKRYDFQLRLDLLDELDTLPFRWHSGLRFSQAVLCYQTGDYARGFNLFRDLRSRFVSGDLQPTRLTSFWRDVSHPTEGRQASVRIQHFQSNWVAYGEVPEMSGQRILTRPRWFEVQPRAGDVRQCHVVFETNGPLAVPTSRRLISMID